VTRDAPSTWIGYQTRFNNSVKYTSNTYSGFSGSVMYAMGEDKTSATNSVDATSSTALNLKYNQGPLLVSFGYQTESTGGTLAAANANTATAKPALENTLLSAAYDFGMAKVGVGFNTAKYKDVTITSAAGNAKDPSQNEYNLSVAVPFGATTVRAGYAVSQGDTFGKASGYCLQAEYAMSKRTFLYTGYSSTDLWDNAVNLANTQAGADVQKVTRFSVGVQHRF
jgi:predicted porin